MKVSFQLGLLLALVGWVVLPILAFIFPTHELIYDDFYSSNPNLALMFLGLVIGLIGAGICAYIYTYGSKSWVTYQCAIWIKWINKKRQFIVGILGVHSFFSFLRNFDNNISSSIKCSKLLLLPCIILGCARNTGALGKVTETVKICACQEICEGCFRCERIEFPTLRRPFT